MGMARALANWANRGQAPSMDPKTKAAVTAQNAQIVRPDGVLRLLPTPPTEEDPAERIRPWERLPRESDRDAALFRAYLNAGYPDGPGSPARPRDIKALAEFLGVPWADLAGLARAFDWVPRAGAWDRHLDRARARADVSVVVAQREAHGRLALKMRTLAEMELDKLLSRAMDPSTPALTAKELLAMVDLTIRLERIFSGEETSTPRAQGDLTPTDLARLDIKDLEALYDIVTRAKAG